jgi:hypothetical protein
VNPWRARLAVLAVFVAGVLCGAAAMHVWRVRLERRAMNSPEGLARIVVHRLDRELNLSEAQRRQVYAAAAKAREESAHVMKPLMPQMSEIFERLRTEVRSVLTDEQRVRFDRMVKERGGRMPRLWMPPPHGPDGMPPDRHGRPPQPGAAPPPPPGPASPEPPAPPK